MSDEHSHDIGESYSSAGVSVPFLVDVVQGASGALGAAIAKVAAADKARIDRVDSRVLVEAARKGDAVLKMHLEDILGEVVRDAMKTGGPVQVNWHCSWGIIDPSVPPDMLDEVNSNLPVAQHRLLSELVEELELDSLKVRYATFGTVLENCDKLVERNAYLQSKRSLFDRWQKASGRTPVTWSHFQLHTLYGGARHQPSMFAGMMESALRERRPFEMSPGDQLREYHHVDDVAESVRHCLSYRTECQHPQGLSSGEPIALRELAERVFDHFRLRYLLRVGALPAPEFEVFSNRYGRSSGLVASREPIAGMIDWLSSRGIRKR